MKILCSYSSIEFNCDHFPGSLTSREYSHPIFHIPQKTLLSFMRKWAFSELTETDSYLLFLALLNSTDNVYFRVPAIRSLRTPAIVANNMEFLSRTISRLNAISSPRFNIPEFVISNETRSLDNVHYWIQAWEDAYKNFQSGNPSAHDSRKLILREAALERMIRNPHKPIASYANQIAEWAAVSCEFPVFLITNPYSPKMQITCSDYWKSLIIKSAALDSSLYGIPDNDLQELYEHCFEHINAAGSIYSHALFNILHTALKKKANYLGTGDIDISIGKYQFVTEEDTPQSANMKALIDSAPLEEPIPSQYPSKLAFLRAKLRWDMFISSSAISPKTPPNSSTDNHE